jgi:transcriptional regulator of heat shock response
VSLYASSSLSSNEELSGEAYLSDPPPSSQQTQSASDEITDEMLMAELKVLEAEYQGEKYDKISALNEEEIKKSEQELDKLEEQFDKKWTTIVSNSKNGPSEISR